MIVGTRARLFSLSGSDSENPRWSWLVKAFTARDGMDGGEARQERSHLASILAAVGCMACEMPSLPLGPGRCLAEALVQAMTGQPSCSAQARELQARRYS